MRGTGEDTRGSHTNILRRNLNREAGSERFQNKQQTPCVQFVETPART